MTDKLEDLKRTPLPLPKANVIRISLLSAHDRERYLGTIDTAIDKTIKQKIYADVYKSNPVFYGIIQEGNAFSLGVTPRWNSSSSGASIGGMVRDLASKTNVGQTIGASGEILKAMTGINASATGSSTMKSYEGTDLSGFTVECAWYLPEQMELCRHSLQILMRMGYPVQVSDTDLAKAMDAVVSAVGQGVSAALTPGKTTASEQGAAMQAAVTTKTNEAASVLATAGAGVVSFVTNALGMNLVLDPLPVRCSIGHYADIEPLIIEDIKLSTTKDTFLDKNTGRHLPIKCTATIQFKFWLTPAPKLQFMELMGLEMFGEGIDSVKQAADYSAKDAINSSSARAVAASAGDIDAMQSTTNPGQNSSSLLVRPNSAPASSTFAPTFSGR